MAEIETAVAGKVHTICINRPDKRNALTGDMYRRMTAALADADQNPGVAVHLFKGQPGAFSAGNDIADFAAVATAGKDTVAAAFAFIRRLPIVEKPMIAAVDGVAVGIGTTLLLHCDLVYATPASIFQTPFLDLGLVPEAGSSLLGPKRLGYTQAFEMLVLGSAFDADKALKAGLINAVVSPEQLDDVAYASAAKLARKPPEALAISRRLLRSDSGKLAERIEQEAMYFEQRLSSPEAQEAFAAFIEKRPATFD